MSSRGLKAVAAGVVIAFLGLLAGGAVMVLLVTSMVTGTVTMAASANPCVAGGAAVAPAGPVRAPFAGQFTYTSAYGMRIHPVLGRAAMHNGADLVSLPAPGPVLAVQAGRVVAAAAAGSAGNMVVIDHGAGLQTRYLHLASMSVQAGADVVAGQRIGVEGSTGRSTGPHLHFEVHQGGEATDPVAWLTSQGVAMPGLGGTGSGAGEVPAGGGVTASVVSAAAGPRPSATVGLDRSNPAGREAAQMQMPTRIGAYGGEQISNAAQIVRAGQDLGIDERGLAIGIMTAIGESTLINVNRGDAVGPDSRGVFQQRANGAWGSSADRMNPRVAATNFFRALQGVDYAAMAPTRAAHAVQANADPNHYAPYWGDAVRILSELTSHPELLASLGAAEGAAPGCDPAAVAAAGGGGGAQVPVASLPPAPPASCAPTGHAAEQGLQPVTLRAMRCSAAAFPALRNFAGVGNRPGKSEHPAGMAVDLMIGDYRRAPGRAFGWQVAQWVRAYAQQLGVAYIIWDMCIWAPGDPDWRPYTRYGNTADDTLAHRDHVHVSFQ